MYAPTRSSARLREQRQVASGAAASPAQSKQWPTLSQSSTRSTRKPNPAKRSKMGHKPEEADGSMGRIVSKLDSRAKGRKGHLEQMAEMPMDVLYEIFGYLEPLDLLRLSWSSKVLRSTVMGKSGKFLWNNAFRALAHAPPPCPGDLNLAQYTKLLFDKRCMECNSPHGTYVLWPHRLRVCGRCLEGERFIALAKLNHYWLNIPVARTYVHGKRHGYVLRSEFDEAKVKMGSLDQSSDEWTGYVKKRGDWIDARRLDEWKFVTWLKEREHDKKNNLEKIKVKRQNEIIAMLGELGWKEELDCLTANQVRGLPGMNVAKPLTEPAWETLCPELVGRLEAIQELRLKREEQDRITERCRILSKRISSWAVKQPQSQYMLPKVLDVAFNEPFKSFIFDDSDTDPTFITNKGELAKLMERFTEEWNEARNQFLLSLLPESNSKQKGKTNAKGKEKATSPSALDLATTFFKCSPSGGACPLGRGVLSYFHILMHHCQRSVAKHSNRRPTDPEGISKLCAGKFTRPWLSDCWDLSFDQDASDVARMIVQLCGENPDEATAEKIGEIDRRLECVRCSEIGKERYIMKWNMAVQHEMDKHPTHGGASSSVSPQGREKKAKRPVEETKWRLIMDPEDPALIQAKGGAITAGGTTPPVQNLSVSESVLVSTLVSASESPPVESDSI